jgi:hypothetical protein
VLMLLPAPERTNLTGRPIISFEMKTRSAKTL